MYSEACLNQPSLGPTFVLGIDRCSLYTGNISYSRIMVYYSGFGLDRFHCILIKMKHHKFVYLWQINCNHFKWQRFYLWVWSLFGKRLKFCNFYACFDICSIYFLSCLWERLSKPWYGHWIGADVVMVNMRQAQPVWRTKIYNFKREVWEGNV